MAVNHTVVSDEQLDQAERIRTVDPSKPHVPGYQLWGKKFAAMEGASAQVTLEIEVPSDDTLSLLRLIGRIERVKGRLPPEVELLRVELAS